MYDACLTNSYTSLDPKFLRPNSNFSFSWPENLLEIYARTLASYGNKMRQTELKTSVSLPSSNSCSAGLYTDATSSLPIYSVRAFSDETSSLPTYSARALFWQIEISSGTYIVYFNCKYFTSLYFIYARAIRMPPRDFLPLGKIPANPCGGNYTLITQRKVTGFVKIV